MCVCAVPWGVLSTVGDILSKVGVFSTVGDTMINVGDILDTVDGVQYRGGYHEYRRVILSTVGVFSTVGIHDACGGYHEYCGGCSVPYIKLSRYILVAQ